MKKNIALTVIQYLLVVSFIVWVGSYVTRHILVFQLFEPKEMELRSVYSIENLGVVFYTLLPVLVTNLISFGLFIILFIIYLIISKSNLRKEGWLFITVLIVFITAPFEVFLQLKDYRIIMLIYENLSNPSEILDLIRKRITVLSSFSLIEIFSYLAIVFLVIIKPLTKSDEAKRERT